METFDTPSINVEKKSNEENMQAVKAYLSELAEKLNYMSNNLQEQIDSIKARL